MIIEEAAGRPYAEFAFAQDWRVIARAAGIPDEVWNSDARTGAITEAKGRLEWSRHDPRCRRSRTGLDDLPLLARRERQEPGGSEGAIAHRGGENSR